MMRMCKYMALLSFAIAGILNCSKEASLAGNSSSETSNGITATALCTSGAPAARALVRLRRSDYVSQPPALAKTAFVEADALTDASGRFQLSGIDTGSYSIEISENGFGVRLGCKLGGHEVADFGSQTLRPLGTVNGSIDTSGMLRKPLFVQVLGMERFVPVDSTGAYAIDDLPAGLYCLHIISVSGSSTTVMRTDQVSAVSGGAVSVTMPGWSFGRKIVLNTTQSGAGVFANVINFPVLVRLTTSNFDFSQAGSAGTDIRFMKQDNTPLPHEIERWDAAARVAEIWVAVDTIFGNDSSHGITMCWGNPGAPSASNGAAVFDTLNGFQGVWHLGQPAGTVAFDATANRFSGIPSDTSPTPVPGVIGTCQEFNGESNYIQMPGTASGKLNFPENGSYSIAAWVYVDTLDSSFAKIIEKHDLQYKLQKDQFNRWEFSEYETAKEYSLTTSPATAKAWVYLTGVRSGGSQYLYVNGVCVTSVITTLASPYSRDTADNVTIGRAAATDFSPLYFFKGRIDEVRMENRVRGADWIKLCYMNQKAGDALVVFRP